MQCTKTGVLLAAALSLAACQPAANDPTSQLLASSGTSSLPSPVSLDLDSTGIVPLTTPIHIAMQPMAPVAFTLIQSNARQPDMQLIMKGHVWFERAPDGLIEQHRTTDSARLQSKTKGIDIPLDGKESLAFQPNGKVWSIGAVTIDMPVSPPANFPPDAWGRIRERTLSSTDPESTDIALTCSVEAFTFAQGVIRTGTPIAPTSRREFFNQFTDCLIAQSRGNAQPRHPENIAFRQELMAASVTDLTEIHQRVLDASEQGWSIIKDVSGDVTVKGMVVRNGQEFAYADGTLRIVFEGGARGWCKVRALIDPYSGLIYQHARECESTGMPEVRGLGGLDGEILRYSIDLPSRMPANVTIAEPRKPVAPGGTGTVVDIYNRSIPAIYKVETTDGTGTAFAISDRQAITAAHVVEGAKTVTLISLSGAQMTATVVKRDPAKDVALLQLTGAQFPSTLNLSPDFAVTGAQVIVIGCPLGACGSVTTGIVSFSARRIQGTALVQIDAQINPGNSGGPILNTNGDVIGIVEEKINPDPNFDGLSFGLSSPEIVGFLGG